MNIKISTFALLGVFLFTTGSQASLLDHALYNVVDQTSNAAGARLGDEIYYGSSGQKTHRKRSRHRAKKRTKRRTRKPVVIAPKMTDEKYIQKALTSLGFYKGRIDGEVNSFETRSAIKSMNIAYGISDSASLLPQIKDTLIYLGRLFTFDRTLIASGSDDKTKGKKIQTALKIHGFYHDKVDGVIGSGTRECIANYKREKLNSSGSALNFEEEYQLISTAKEMNDKNIDESIASLKQVNVAQGQIQKVPTQQVPSKTTMPALKAYQPKSLQTVPAVPSKTTVAQPSPSQPVTTVAPQNTPNPQPTNTAK